jgi:hypothetical protein
LKFSTRIVLLIFVSFLFNTSVFASGTDTVITSTSTQKQAIDFIDSIQTLEPSGYWPHVKSSLFLSNLKLNIHEPLSFYPGRGTNFCAYGALSYLVIKDDPLGYARFMLTLYRTGKASYNNNNFTPSESIKAAAGTLKFKGVLDIRHAEQMWFLVLADHFKGYLNIFNPNYDLGDEDRFWAATNLAKFNRMVRKMCHYKTKAVGSDLFHPWLKNTFNYLHDRLGKGVMVLYINNRVIHKKNHDKVKLSIPTHFVVLENIRKEDNGLVTLTYWDYGGKTLLQITPKVLKKIIYGISFCTKNELL